MKKPLIVNLNLAIDKTVYIPDFRRGKTYRFSSALTMPGGKGANVARVLKTLGIKSRIMGIAAGYNGEWIEDSLKGDGFETQIIKHKDGESRICYSITEKGGVSTDLNEDGCRASKFVQTKFISKFKKIVRDSSFISVSGRTPPGIRKGFYAKLVKLSKSAGLPVAFDIRGKYLTEGIRQGIDFVKVNKHEFEEASRLSFSPANVRRFYEKYRCKGLKAVIVTNKGRPGYCVSEKGMIKFIPPRIKREIKSAVGAGDSFMAGFIFGCLKNFPLAEIIRFAVACSVADCVSLGAGLIRKKHVKKFINGILIQKITF